MKNSIHLMSTLLIGVAFISCNNAPKNQEKVDKSTTQIEAQPQVEKTNTEEISNPTKVYQVGEQVPNDLVCMVNNAFMGRPQIAVPVNGKTYYGCCEMCVGTLTNDKTARTGIDPFSKTPVDKTEAYIVLMKAEGEVAYFESKENFLNYKKK
ncbi:MAG: hypothetical protein KKC03_09340 [Bacteroidetes bacterium]|nr:hypothetical protein [Bacteroidota bacterium]